MNTIVVSGSFDNLQSPGVRFLEEAARLGELHVELWGDELVRRLTGQPPKFPASERLYFVQAIRYVSGAALVSELSGPDELAHLQTFHPQVWVVGEQEDTPGKRSFARTHGLDYQVIKPAQLSGFPLHPYDPQAPATGHTKVLVSGCYDWLHSGHIRFFEEVSGYGDLYVVAGNDANVRFLKGPGHPKFNQDERRYMVQSIRYVHQALITSGEGWLDAAPEMELVKPDLFAVNEDGDRPEKRQLCQQLGIQYLVLKRTPKEGLPRRESTKLRGF